MNKNSKIKLLICVFLAEFITFFMPQPVLAQNRKLTSMSLEELMHLEVTSVSKKPEDLQTSASAVHVITNQDIKMSTARNIPDLLRTVPGVNVAQFDANKWFVSIRGFNKLFANQLLVLIDGKTTYTQLFNGVYWDTVDLLLEDVDRIEIIRGPGSSVWGANAVNGVVNIISKSAKETHGLYARAGAGNYEPYSASLRYGEALNDRSSIRYWSKVNKTSNFEDTDKAPAYDAADAYKGGVRMDTELDKDQQLTFNLNGFGSNHRSTARSSSAQFPEVLLSQQDDYSSGLTALAEYNLMLEENNNWKVKTFFDRFWRQDSGTSYYANTFDLEVENVRQLSSRFTMVSGFGGRYLDDKVYNSDILNIKSTDPEQQFSLFSAFLQGEYQLVPDKLDLTLGSKIEHQDYTGFEYEPTLRLGYKLNTDNFIWSSFSRSVRMPSRVDDNIFITDYSLGVDPVSGAPVAGLATPNNQLDSEISYSYEAGYRAFLDPDFSLDLAAFITNYQGLVGRVPGQPELGFADQRPAIFIPAVNENSMHAESKGVETSLTWKPNKVFDFRLAYTVFDLSLMPDSDRPEGTSTLSQEADTPGQNITLQTRYSVFENLDLSAFFSYVSAAPSIDVDSYSRLGLKASYGLSDNLKLNVYGQNLIEEHIEAQSPILVENTELPRVFFAEISYIN